MAFGPATLNSAAGAVSDILGGEASRSAAYARAAGTRISANALRLKASGDIAEADQYDLASGLASQNEQFTEQSTAIKLVQQQREIYRGLGTLTADVGGAGLRMSGSALDLLRSSASEGALTKAVLQQQGLITEAGYREQAQSYDLMSKAARFAAAKETEMAGQTDDLAKMEEQSGDKAEEAGNITGAIKGAAAIASLFI